MTSTPPTRESKVCASTRDQRKHLAREVDLGDEQLVADETRGAGVQATDEERPGYGLHCHAGEMVVVQWRLPDA